MRLSKAHVAIVSYGVMSILITLFNKAVLSTYKFSYANTLTLAQSVTTLVCLSGLKQFGLVKFEELSIDTAVKVFPLSVIFLLYVVISLSALGAINLPMFTALRRTTILLVLAGEYVFLSKYPSRKTLIATAVMTLGAVIAAYKDLTFDLYAYVLLALTNLSTAGYTIAIAHVKKSTNLSVFGMLYYNTLLTLPFLAAIVLVSGELDAVAKFPYLWDLGFQFFFLSSALMAFGLNIATFFATALNSPLAVNVCGQVKNFGAFLFGLVLFDDYIYDHINMFGLCLGFYGALMYGHWSYQESVATKVVELPKPTAAAETVPAPEAVREKDLSV